MSGAGSPRPIGLSIEAALAGRVRVGTLWAAPVVVAPASAALEAEIDALRVELASRFGGAAPGSIAELAPARELYRIFGIDPTKVRPSSEKLLRRVLQRRPLPRVSNAVDLANALALRFLLPIGLYDAARVQGEVALRAGAPAEAYRGIAGQDVHLAGRPLLADRAGAFGNPTADSARTAVGGQTRELWLTLFAPASYPAERLARHVDEAAARFARHLAGEAPVRTGVGLVG